MKIFHIVPREIWHQAKSEGIYQAESLQNEGFIHCSKADQILGVANSFFKGQDHLLLLRIDSTKVESEIKLEAPLEAPMSDIQFPHIYGPLNLSSVEKEFDFVAEEDGTFMLPEDLL